MIIGGEGGIRTLGTLARSTVFETAPFDHSGTSPREASQLLSDKPAANQMRAWHPIGTRGPRGSYHVRPMPVKASLIACAPYYRRCGTGGHKPMTAGPTPAVGVEMAWQGETVMATENKLC
jgi:hypothetical protein